MGRIPIEESGKNIVGEEAGVLTPGDEVCVMEGDGHTGHGRLRPPGMYKGPRCLRRAMLSTEGKPLQMGIEAPCV